jgi:hypothetical protein
MKRSTSKKEGRQVIIVINFSFLRFILRCFVNCAEIDDIRECSNLRHVDWLHALSEGIIPAYVCRGWELMKSPETPIMIIEFWGLDLNPWPPECFLSETNITTVNFGCLCTKRLQICGQRPTNYFKTSFVFLFAVGCCELNATYFTLLYIHHKEMLTQADWLTVVSFQLTSDSHMAHGFLR